ncbi:MAG: PD-(D/E)XK nuclease family protein, partial [Oscillospiraceae bacterium]|nr:PD-(D/E)XK nuclease family protein [Oscillospiraceae bacterium]
DAISREGKNLFTVGDVKQSIYRFRLADPTIFLEKYKRFSNCADALDGEERRVLLSQNFRSRPQVLDAANFVFENILSAEMGEIDYGENERLYCGADYYPDAADRQTEFHIIDLPRQAADAENRLRAADVEANFVAARIRAMLDEGYEVFDTKTGAMRRVCAEDFAILMRSPRARLASFKAALSACGIPCGAGRGGSFFATLEISVTVALLTILDNPHQDVPLISVLRSPVFGFSPDRLAQLRANTKDGDFYDALAADEGEDARCCLAVLAALREDAREMRVSRFLWHAAQRLGLFGIFGAMPDGAARCERLTTLFSWAEGFEKTGGGTLFDFVTHLHGLLERGEIMEDGGEGVGGVSVMSIHKSKGLEFPVVFLCDLAKPFNDMDLRESVLVHPQLGVGPVCIDLARHIKYPTVARKCIEGKLRREARAEELRVLYVGMTRAREKLIMVTTLPNARSKLQKLAAVASCPVQPELVAAQGSFSDWLLLPLLCRAEAGALRAYAEAEVGALWTGEDSDWRVSLHDGAAVGAAAHTDAQNERVREDISFDAAALDWEYPYRASVALSAKVTATQLKGRESDEEIADGAPVQARLRALRRPRFLEQEMTLTPAQRGTATHTLLQFLDFSHDACSVEEQLATIVERRLLTRAQADAVDITSVQSFVESDLFARIAAAKNVRREYIFSLLVDARTLDADAAEDDHVLLQGVVDCFFENEDGSISIVDFKTDRVRKGEEAARAETYRAQISAYALALSRILEKPVRERILYFLATGGEVKV